jgi:hypothetical protein
MGRGWICIIFYLFKDGLFIVVIIIMGINRTLTCFERKFNKVIVVHIIYELSTLIGELFVHIFFFFFDKTGLLLLEQVNSEL